MENVEIKEAKEEPLELNEVEELLTRDSEERYSLNVSQILDCLDDKDGFTEGDPSVYNKALNENIILD